MLVLGDCLMSNSWTACSQILKFIFSAAGPSDPEPRPDQWWVDRHNGFVENTIGSGGAIPIIFYGDSITEGWGGAGKPTFDAEYAPLGVANYGIGGDQTQHVLWRILNGEIEGLNPKLIVLKIGTNNLGFTNDEIVGGVTTIVNTLRELLPSTKILLLGILPRGNTDDLFSRVSDINIKISKLEDMSMVFFLNMFDQFSTAWPVVDSTLFNGDLLHLEAPGYQKWAQTMEHLFHELIETKH